MPLRAEQLSPEIPRLILNLYRLVDDASSRLSGTDWADWGRMQKRWHTGPFQYMVVASLSTWFGINHEHCRQYETRPLWFGLNPSAWEEYEKQILRSLKPIRWKGLAPIL